MPHIIASASVNNWTSRDSSVNKSCLFSEALCLMLYHDSHLHVLITKHLRPQVKTIDNSKLTDDPNWINWDTKVPKNNLMSWKLYSLRYKWYFEVSFFEWIYLINSTILLYLNQVKTKLLFFESFLLWVWKSQKFLNTKKGFKVY